MSKMMLVEDNKLSQKMMFYTLRNIGVQADMADDGKMAVEKAIANGYDVILMDIMMPELNGYEATQKIREYEKSSNTKRSFIIGLTSNVYDSERAKCIEAGMDEYLPKPFDADSFIEMVRHYKVMDI